MANTHISFGSTLDLEETAQLIAVCGDVNKFFLRGEPGIGKSSIMRTLKEILGERYAYAYIDVSTLDLGDIGFPGINHDERVAEFFPNVRFAIHRNMPVVIMLDEFTKGMQPVQNMLHPLLEADNPRLGDKPLPPGSIVFLTGNLGSDGVGDTLKAHSIGRITVIDVRKPNAELWLGWAVNNDIDPVIMAWVNQFPHCLESYTSGDQEGNPYIFNPKKPNRSYVSPRSLARASNPVSRRDQITPNALVASLIGTLGEAAARDLHAYVDYQDQLPLWSEVVKNPTKAKLPEAPGACAVMIFGAVTKVTGETIDPWMTYIARMEPEWQAVFAVSIAKNPQKQGVAFMSRAFRDWVLKNEDIL